MTKHIKSCRLGTWWRQQSGISLVLPGLLPHHHLVLHSTGHLSLKIHFHKEIKYSKNLNKNAFKWDAYRSLFTVGGSPSQETPPGRRPSGQRHPPGQTPPDRDPPGQRPLQTDPPPDRDPPVD